MMAHNVFFQTIIEGGTGLNLVTLDGNFSD